MGKNKVASGAESIIKLIIKLIIMVVVAVVLAAILPYPLLSIQTLVILIVVFIIANLFD